MRPPGEYVEIPFEGKKLKGVLRGKGPVLIMAPGLDSTKEEIHAYEEPFLARGIAVLAIDGPGQGEAEYEIPICGDYERAATAVVDWIETRSDLDRREIAIWGVSLGGYYAPRAAAYEKRFKACIALVRAVRLGADLGRAARPDPRDLPGAQPLEDGRRCQGKRSETHVARCRKEHHLPAVRRRRASGPPGAGVARRAARKESLRGRSSC